DDLPSALLYRNPSPPSVIFAPSLHDALPILTDAGNRDELQGEHTGVDAVGVSGEIHLRRERADLAVGEWDDGRGTYLLHEARLVLVFSTDQEVREPRGGRVSLEGGGCGESGNQFSEVGGSDFSGVLHTLNYRRAESALYRFLMDPLRDSQCVCALAPSSKCPFGLSPEVGIRAQLVDPSELPAQVWDERDLCDEFR